MVDSSNLDKFKQIGKQRSNASFDDKMDDMVTLKKILIDDLEINFENVLIKQQGVGQKKVTSLPTSSYWKVEADQFLHGGKLHWERLYRIRHFQTGRYLEIDMNGRARLHNQGNKNTLFTFIALHGNNQKFIMKDSFFYLKHYSTGLMLGIDEKQNKPQLKNEQSYQTTFKMRKVDFEDIWETRFLLFSLPLLMEAISFVGNMKQNRRTNHSQPRYEEIKEQTKFYHLFQKVNKMLETLDSFVKNRMISNIQQAQDYSSVSRNRQNVVREENVLVLLCWLLYRVFPDQIKKV